MRVTISELIHPYDRIEVKDRHPSDSVATVCRLSIVEAGNIAAEVQLNSDAAIVLRAALGAAMGVS